MIELKQDYSAYLGEISRIAKGEKVKITASISQMRKIKESSDFYFVPFTDRNGEISDNNWLLSLKKMKIAVLVNSKMAFDKLITRYDAAKMDNTQFHLVLNLSNVIGNNFDGYLIGENIDTQLIEACKYSIR